MAIAKLPDMDALAIELVQLERRELEISALRRKLHDRLNSFPNEFTQRRERELSDERRAVHHRIDELRSTARAAAPALAARAPQLNVRPADRSVAVDFQEILIYIGLALVTVLRPSAGS